MDLEQALYQEEQESEEGLQVLEVITSIKNSFNRLVQLVKMYIFTTTVSLNIINLKNEFLI